VRRCCARAPSKAETRLPDADGKVHVRGPGHRADLRERRLEPPLRVLAATPIRVEPGDGFRFTCEWKNDDGHPVRFGVTTNEEMCFMVGYYYRDDESVPPPPVPSCLLQRSGLLCSATTVP